MGELNCATVHPAVCKRCRSASDTEDEPTASSTRFTALNVRPDVAKVKVRESDFHEVYEGANPSWYLVYVCPVCLFAAYPDDFGNVAAED